MILGFVLIFISQWLQHVMAVEFQRYCGDDWRMKLRIRIFMTAICGAMLCAGVFIVAWEVKS